MGNRQYSDSALDECLSCSTSGHANNPGEQVLADSNLVWQITNALQAAPSIWDFHKWYSLSTVNKAFHWNFTLKTSVWPVSYSPQPSGKGTRRD
ncbi:hypothetical protein WJX75_005081 [Coccomyxa subellipsoidea]|uniref:Uncharacterized protein n=1 Tax=Coccomyxa subellipsoidea TaxID=248742 RepID=A0ABR2YZX9_9CHLO